MWYKTEGKDSDVVLNSRVALHRNLEDYPFSDKMTDEQAASLIEKLKTVYTEEGGWTATDLSSLSEEQRKATAEQHVITRMLAEKKGPAAIFQNADQSVTVAAGGEDHVVITAVVPGNDPEAAMKAAFAAEEKLDEACAIAFTEQFGYITHDPAEMGTGMKAAVTVHLPVSTDTGWVSRVAFRLNREGIGLRSLDGSGTRTGLYLVVNRETMGVPEEEIVKTVGAAVDRLAEKERELRNSIGEQRKARIAETVRRDYGMILYSGDLKASELLALYSEMRLGAAMKLVEIPTTLVDETMFTCLPHTLAAAENRPAKEEMGAERAARAKEILSAAPLHAGA